MRPSMWPRWRSVNGTPPDFAVAPCNVRARLCLCRGGLKNGKRKDIMATVQHGDAELLVIPGEKASPTEGIVLRIF